MADAPVTRRATRHEPVVLLTTALAAFLSVSRASALALTELGVGLFVVMGIAGARAGAWALPAVVAATLLAVYTRRLDVTSWGLLLPGGLPGRLERAFGRRGHRIGAAAVLTERLLLAAFASVIVGDHFAHLMTAAVGLDVLGHEVTSTELAAVLAVAVITVLWIRMRLGRLLPVPLVAHGVWIGVSVLGVILALATWSLGRAGGDQVVGAVTLPWPAGSQAAWDSVTIALLAFCLVLPTVGGGDALTRLAHEFPAPRLGVLRRTARIVMWLVAAGTILLTIAFLVLVPAEGRAGWAEIPLAGLIRHLSAPGWVRAVLQAGLGLTTMLFLVPAIQACMVDAGQLLRRLAATGVLPEALAMPHPRLGTLTKSLDVVTAASVLLVLTSAGRVAWLGGAYATAIAATVALRSLAIARLRRTGVDGLPASGPTVIPRKSGGSAGPTIVAVSMAIVAAFMMARGEGAWLAAAALVLGLTLLLSRQSQPAQDEGLGEAEGFELLASSAIAVEDAHAQPGNILVAVRHPHALEHVAAALQSGADREVVVMTVRLHGVDTDGASPDDPTPLPSERYLFSRVITLVERYGRPVRLLVVPAATVADGLATAVVRLRSSVVYVGESATLSSADQARLLGEAWERIPKPEPLDVRLVVHHRSGRADTYYMGAHLPAFTPADLDLIHRVWREATQVIGPHVHHHDVVRAALTQMEAQLNGPDRDEALARIRDTARPAEELAAVIRARDFTRLRDMVRNRPSSEVAEVLTALGLDEQVLAFRVLPRKDAAAVFEYLTHESQEALLKAMAQEDVAALLNDMAPDDRTMFLEELPAAATRQLLTLLTPEERAVAVNLLGYPEGSIGRLMTPHYVAVREQWTVREVLDYVRRHGRDSETLNMLYVVDDHDALIDDIRIREFLLTDPDRRVAELMDRRFVALKATDDQATAVAAFRQHDRTALPVTDTAGMLIGIVTIDDVLDVAEAAATREIQRIGGSEALDEPYMRIAFARMIQKRAGWLTALFLGEMLTASAMGFFEAEISKAVVLALFIPLIISSGGNSGSQASTLVIRALALGEVGLADWWRVMRREIFAGLALGSILGAIGFLRITIWSGFSNVYTEHWLLVATTVAITLLLIVLWGTVVGSLLPLLLRRLGFDPATSSAPFVATLVDVTGLVIYFSVALVILRGSLL
jgi:magnesium transporter